MQSVLSTCHVIINYSESNVFVFMKKYYRIDHRHLFLFGYVFYFLTPYLFGISDAFTGLPGVELYQSFFKKIPQEQLVLYAIITLTWLPAFYFGHFCFSLLKPYKRSLQLFPQTVLTRSVDYIAVLLLGVLAVFAFISRNSILGGYGSYDIGARGKMSTLLVVYNFFLAYQLVSRQKVSYLLMAGAAATAILLLTMGGRMYVMQTFIVLLMYKTSFARRRFSIVQFAVFGAVAFIVATFVGIWRLGIGFNPFTASYSLFAEPVFTWFSTSAYLGSNPIPLFNIPMNFLTSFLNLVPNTFFSLQQYAVPTSRMAANYQNPLGADSIWTNVVINFGSLGSVFFFFVTGFLLNFLRHNSESRRFGAAYYILVCSLLPFQFFRDGFYLLNKQLFFNFLLLPAAILLTTKTILYLQSFVPALSLQRTAGR